MSTNNTPPLEVHPEKIPDSGPVDPLLVDHDFDASWCWLHITDRGDGQHVARLEYLDHGHGEDNVLCVPLDLDDEARRAISRLLAADTIRGRATFQNALNDLATQIVRQMEHNAAER